MGLIATYKLSKMEQQLTQCVSNFRLFFIPLLQTNPSGQHWCFSVVCVLASLSHWSPSSSRYTVEQTATMATPTTPTIARGTGSITLAVVTVPTISTATVTQTVLLLWLHQGPGLLGTASPRSGTRRLTSLLDDAGGLRELCCTPPCSHQLRVHTDRHTKHDNSRRFRLNEL